MNATYTTYQTALYTNLPHHYRVLQKSCPLLKNSRPYCCHAMGPAMDSPTSQFQKVPAQFSQLSAISFAQSCTGRMGWMANRKCKETKHQQSMLPDPAVPGSCLVSFNILWAILSTSTVECIFDFPENFCGKVTVR